MKPVLGSFTQPEADRRKFLTGLLFGSAAAFAYLRRPRVKLDYLGADKLEVLIPKTIGKWKYETASGLVVPPDDPFEKLIYAQVLTRIYVDGKNPPIMLLVAQNGSQTGFLQIHRPEICYTAGGYEISPITPHPIPVNGTIVPANRMDATNGGPVEHVVYWTRVGDQIPPTWRDQKLAVAEQNLKGVIPDAILVRISTVSNDGDTALQTIDQFVSAMLNSVPPSRRPVFTG
ncbi:MAG TPA: EpsI family protein [Sphingomicrobium sp.]|nr:EpsI family protein [Sphingomicrobium sp.]